MELEPDAISEFWVPDSFFQHAKDAKAVRIMNPQASLQVTPEKMVIYVEMYVYYYSFLKVFSLINKGQMTLMNSFYVFPHIISSST